MKRLTFLLILVVHVISTTYSSGNEEITWSEESHSNSVEPNYDVVFNSSEVMEIHIEIDKDDWEAMMTQLDEELQSDGPMGDRSQMGGRPGMGGGRGMGGGPNMGGGPGMGGDTSGMGSGPEMGEMSEMGGRPGMDDGNTRTVDFDPMWVESDLTVNGVTWENVGIRVKGNSSLMKTHSMGDTKFSFKLDFDQYEDEYPELNNQRFYGFKQLNLNNNFSDNSFIRESVAADLFRDYGLTASETALCMVYVDYGKGSELFGLYTVVEEMDDTTIDNNYEDGSGNLYKPDGKAATFAEGSYNEEQFYKKSNTKEADYSDVDALYTVINSSERVDNHDLWKENLEAVFDVDTFLKWLAVNTVIQNWDTYGQMSHNFYLYNNPATGKLEWIPWDNNESLKTGNMKQSFSLNLKEATDQWPLIRYIIDDSDYYSRYIEYVEDFTTNYFNVERMTNIYDGYYALLKEYATQDISEYQFTKAVDNLKIHVADRNSLVEEFVK